MAVERYDAPAENLDQIKENADNVDREKAEANPPNKNRPDWLQDKFSSPEELAKAYSELERKLGTQSGKPKAPEMPREQPHEGRESPKQEVQQGEKPTDSPNFLPGLDNNEAEAISNYAWEHRSLSDEHYEKLAKAGYSRDIVDEFMAGQFARADTFQNTLVEAGGGAENVEAMFNWARNNMTPEQIAGYDSMFDQGGPQAVMAMENLRAKFENSGQSMQYSGVTGANAAPFETSVYHSTADVIEAMNDPRYQTNPTYRAEVMRKLSRSKDVNF